MPLEKDYSIIADSTEPSSPRLDMEHSASPKPIKRVARTYGKPRESSVNTNNQDTSTSRPISRDIVHHTAPPGLSEQVPSTSSPSRMDDVALDDVESPTSTPAKFAWGWKAKLQALDADEEDDDEAPVAPGNTTEEVKSVFGNPSMLLSKPKLSSTLGSGDIQASPQSQMETDDVFAAVSLSAKSPSSGTLAKNTFSLSSPQIAPRKQARRSIAYTASDSENDAPKPSSSNSPFSSQPLHGINTPKSKSLHTSPPTSDEEMGLTATGKSRSTGKKKAQPTRNVPPLTLVPSSEANLRTALPLKRGKVKAPTKKDQEELAKERVRLVAESNAAVPRDTAQKFTKARLLERINNRVSTFTTKKIEIPQSDPIETFSPIRPTHRAIEAHAPKSSELEHDSDEELPEVSTIFKARATQQKKAELQEKKKRALEMINRQPTRPATDSEDDLELEIVLPNPKTGAQDEENRRSAKKKYVSEARKQQLRLAQVGTSRQREVKGSVDGHGHGPSGSDIFLRGARLPQQSLSRVMVAAVREDARKMTSKKEEEWKKHGGRVAAHPEAHTDGLAAALQTITSKAADTAQQDADIEEEDDEDASDHDWTPEMRGSASPEPAQDASHDDNDDEIEEENDENMLVDHDTAMVDENDGEALDEPKIRASRRMVVASDSEEEEENNENASLKRMPPSNHAAYRRATSSAELTEGEQDKENNAFDFGDNKENDMASRSFSSFDIPSPTQSSSTTVRDPRRSEWADALRSTQQRKPFQELIPEPTLVSPSQTSFAAKLLQSTRTPVTTPGASLKPFISGGLQSEKSFGGFSQLFNAEGEDGFGSAPLLQPAFGGLFKSKGGASDFFDDQDDSENITKEPLKRADTLCLTQEVHAAAKLQPGFQAADNLIRRADSIFEKEQAFLLEAAVKKPAPKPELYVNDHGFLTQTRPVDGTPDVYQRSPSQRSLPVSPSQPSTRRAPLGTLSYSRTLQPESPEILPLRRLRKNVTPPPGGRHFDFGTSSTTPPRKTNAFDLLAQGAARNRDEKKHKSTKEEIAAFLENEAAESDEDDNFGFGKAKKTDDDEDGEDLDQTLDILMDDNAMDEETVAADLVMEKFKQQEEEHDQNLEKLHMAAIQGELRRKRTRGVGVDDSDDDSEDDTSARARRAMKKLRTSDRGDIKHLEANEATRSFAQTYNQSLKDDDNEFAYLNKDTQLDDILTASRPDDDDDEDEEEEEEQPPETISIHEVRRQLREAAEEGEDMDDIAMDPEDVSWMENDDDEPTTRVKTVNSRPRPKAHLDDGELGGLLDKPLQPTTAFSKQWIKQEFKARNAGTSRSVGGSAITGHSKAKPKPTVKSSLKAQGNDNASTGKKGLRAEKSMLSAITDKSRHFA